MNPNQYSIQPSGCWKWLLSVNRDGYGQVAHGKPKKMLKAHRLSYELKYGRVPIGKVLDHLCRNRWCVNPDHVEPVTDRVNVVGRGEGITAINNRKTHCAHGHELSGYNLVLQQRTFNGRPRTSRICRACRVANTQRWRLKLHEARQLSQGEASHE